ncbi:MAG: UDP-glucose 4-epimerase GalE [Ruminococcaceae bacterium]|nr:UDP-glucose 4-epimerase GalE [Oscillospiraceae bacterium]
MKVLLTGGAGYIGSHTIIEMCEAGHEVVVVDNFSNSSKKSVERVEQILGKRIPLYEADVADKEAMDRIFAEHAIDAVVHFAGLKAVGESVRKPLEYYENNLISTLVLLRAMEKAGVKKLIFSSSATVYGNPEKCPITEDSPTGNCSNPYGWTKYMIEQILFGYCVAHPEMQVILLRYFNPVGAHKSGRIGEMPNGIPNNLMPYVTQVAVGKLKELSVFGNDYPTPDGTGVRDYIHVVDLARGHVAALQYDKPGAEVFNLGTGVGYSVLDMVHTFSRENGVEVPYRIAPRREGDIAACYADPAKAERVLGWRATHTLSDMVRDSWRWQSQNPNGYEE